MGTDQTNQGGAVAQPTAHLSSAENQVPLPEEIAHLDGRLMHELSALNYQLGLYVLRYYDADAGRTEAVSIADERSLADGVAAASDAIRARAARREVQDGGRR
jgi:hypothetical protein